MKDFMFYLNVKLFVVTEKLSDFMKMGLKHYKIYCHCVDDGMDFLAFPGDFNFNLENLISTKFVK